MLTRTTTPGGNTSTIDFGLTETVLTSSTTTTAKYYFVAGQRVAEQVGSTFSYLIPNLEGSPTVALSSTGYVSAVQLFLPYGASGFAWGTMPTAHNYTDQLLDSVMGLLYYGARYYDPLADQFVSADSVQGNPSGMNPYGYVGGNPETLIDPSGYSWQSFWQNFKKWWREDAAMAAFYLTHLGAGNAELVKDHQIDWTVLPAEETTLVSDTGTDSTVSGAGDGLPNGLTAEEQMLLLWGLENSILKIEKDGGSCQI